MGTTLSSAGAAASLAHAHQKSLGSWKPETPRTAEKAAVVAKDYRVIRPSSAENLSPEVFKAAVLASRDSASPTQWPDSADDHFAEEKFSVIPRRQIQEKSGVEIESGAVSAASGALSRSRRRAESAPVKPAFRPEATYALSAAAAISHRTGLGNPAKSEGPGRSMEAARIHNMAKTNVQLYTSTPPVELEVEERNRKDTLQAAAVSMAKDMYAIAQARTEESSFAGPASSTAQSRYHSQRLSPSQDPPSDDLMSSSKPTNLHEVAQKIVAEKMAQMQQNDDTWGQYYGTPTRSRLSMSRKLRRRSSSESDASKFDKQKSMEIRNQMSFLQSCLHELNSQKSRDRAELMEIARRNVNSAIHDMDEKSYARTGKLSPNVQREWEEKARERANAESEARLSIFGKIAIGGDKYVDDAEVKAIARARIQPTLDEISTQVEEQRAKEMEQRLDEKQRKRLQEIEQNREAEAKSEQKQGKGM